MIPLTVVGAAGKPLNGTCMTSAGRPAVEHLRQLQLPRREDVVSARGNEEARIRDDGRRAHGAVRDSSRARPHHRPRRGDVRLPGIYRRRQAVDRPHRRPAGRVARQRAASRFDQLAAWKECNDCAFIPVCAGGCSVAAHTELGNMNRPNCHKSSIRIRCRIARARCGRGFPELDQLAASKERTEDSGHEERQKGNGQEKDLPAPVARRRRRRAPALTGGVTNAITRNHIQEERP